MRLINIHTLDLSEDFDVDIPNCVTASHRWLRKAAETTFADIQKRRNTDKDGYKKLQGFAAYVRVHIPHVQWLGIDTCCIYKDSDAEMSEAINSMCEWYKNAEVCLAYLADVNTRDDQDAFRQSEWFRRGWTLQELLVPSTVVFLTRTWEVIGHKGKTGRGKTGID